MVSFGGSSMDVRDFTHGSTRNNTTTSSSASKGAFFSSKAAAPDTGAPYASQQAAPQPQPQNPFSSHLGSGTGQASTGSAAGAAGVFGSTAFAELDANQDPIQRMRFASGAGGSDSSSMGDQAKQQQMPPTFSTGSAGPTGNAAAAPTASWAAFLSGVQHQSYVSPGAKAGSSRRPAQRRGATPRASRMQPRAGAAAAGGDAGQSPPLGGQAANGAPGAGGPPAPTFAFGSSMDAAAQSGATPLVPGTAMSTDSGTVLPDFTAAFSAMSVDAATPAAFGVRGGRAAAVTGKRLFDTPSSAGAESGGTPSPFGFSGQPAAEQRGAAAQHSPAGGPAGVRAAPVPFPGFGHVTQQDAAGGGSNTNNSSSGSPAGSGFAFNAGKATPGTSKARQRGSPGKRSPQAVPAFGGFGSPAVGRPAVFGSSSSSQAAAGSSSSPSFVPQAAAGFSAGGSSSSTLTPGVPPSGGSFQGFFAGKAPGSVASTPGYSPMMWSPVDNQAQATDAASPAATAEGGIDPVAGRQQSAAAYEQVFDARLRQAQEHLAEQQQQQQAATTAADAATAAAAVNLPSDDSVESVAELLADLSTAGRHGPAQAAPETEEVAGLRAAVEQLSTAETNLQQQQSQQRQPQPPVQQQQEQQPQAAVPSFFFGSPEQLGAGSNRANSSSAWLGSPGAPVVTPTTLFDMSPLKASLAGLGGGGGSGGGAAGGANPAAAAAATVHASTHAAAGPAGVGGPAAGAAAAAATAGPSSVAAGSTGDATSSSAAGFSFTPGKGKTAAGGAARPAARARKQTPVKPQRAPPPAAATAAGMQQTEAPMGGTFGAAAAEAAALSGETKAAFTAAFFAAQQQQQQAASFGSSAGFQTGGTQPPAAAPHQQQASGGGQPTPRRKVHAVQRRGAAASPQQQQQQQAASAQWQWPPSAQQQQQQPWPPGPAAAPPSFTLGSSKGAASGGAVRSPRKGRPAQQQQQQQQQQQPQAVPQPGVGLPVQQALQAAKACMDKAQALWGRRWEEAESELTRGIYALVGMAADSEEVVGALSELHNHRAAARIGLNNPLGALEDALSSIRYRKKSIKSYLRVSTCLVKLGCLTAADRVLDKVLDMISASSSHWHELNTKRRHVQQLVHKQHRVVAAALGCDTSSAAAAVAAVSAGQPVRSHLEGFVSTTAAAAAAAGQAALVDAGTTALEDAEAAKELLKDAEAVANELEFWEDGAALHAWLLLRSGQLDVAAAVTQAKPNPYFVAACRQQRAGGHPEWRWWLMAQVKWHQGDLTAVQQLLQQGQAQLQKLNNANGSSAGSSSVWHLLLPNLQELLELLQHTQQLLSLKEAGNTAVKAKQFDKAAEEYTKVLALQPSCGFAAVIHSNRAAAFQQQQRLVEALADCSRAVALDPRYARAYLRMAQILEALHRADRAVVVLQDALKGSANAVDPATTRGHELTHGATVLRLSSDDRRKFEDMLAAAQSTARKFKTAHHYKALGLTLTASEADIRKAYRALALKHHPDKALQHCRWAVKMGRAGAASAHVTAASGGIEASLKAAANEVFGFLSAAHEELTNSISRSKLDRDLRTEEQLYSNSSSTYGNRGRPASYTYSQGGRRAPDYGYDDLFRNTRPSAYGGSSSGGRTGAGAQQQGSYGGAGSSRASGSGGGQNKWYEESYWADPEDEPEPSDEDEYQYSYGGGGGGYHYRSKY